jgi:DNA processing protein
VVPGSIFSPTSQGANQLIADGAYVITSERDLEARISLDYDLVRASASDGCGRPGGRVLSALIGEPMRADDLARHLDAPVLDVIRCLSDYQARGVVERMPDGRFSLSAHAYLARDRTHSRGSQGRLDLGEEGDAGT